jgi:hypothetical protein
MFLHEFYQHRDPSFFEDPQSAQLSAINRAALVGATEWLCHRFGYEVPSWTERPEFFLESERNWFDDWDTSEPDGVIFKEVFTAEFISSIREESIQRSAQEFLRRKFTISGARTNPNLGPVAKRYELKKSQPPLNSTSPTVQPL